MRFLSRLWRYSRSLFWCAGDDVQGMDAPAHQRRQRRIDQPVALELRTPAESFRHELHLKVTPLAGAGMPRVSGTVIDDLERQRRELALNRRADLANYRIAHRRLASDLGGGLG